MKRREPYVSVICPSRERANDIPEICESLKMIVDVGEWQLEVDSDATRLVYASTSRGSPADCDCNTCRNFAALSDAAYPPSFRELAQGLGIDVQKAAEIYASGEEWDDGLEYAGWFHCIGRIHRGQTDWSRLTSLNQWPWYALNDDFKIVIDTRRVLVFDEFGQRPLVKIEFQSKLPWVLQEANSE